MEQVASDHGTARDTIVEVLVPLATVPGVIAMVVLGLGLVFERLGWYPDLGELGYYFAWVAVFTPMLVLMGAFTLVGSAFLTVLGPGRLVWKRSFLVGGTCAWGLAFYWLSVPGLVELP